MDDYALKQLVEYEEDRLVRLVLSAGGIIGMMSTQMGRAKDDGSSVTSADIAIHNLISEELRNLELCPVVSEEASTEVDPRTEPVYWLVDPLDGTSAFLDGSDEYSVNIALVIDGQPRYGVVYSPRLRFAMCGGRGLGIRANNGGNSTVVIPDPRAKKRTSPLVLSSRQEAEQLKIKERLQRLGADCEISPCSSSVKLCLLACYEADAYPRLGPTHAWDIAAGQALVEGAGGRVLSADGNDLNYKKEGWLNDPFVAYMSSNGPWLELLADKT